MKTEVYKTSSLPEDQVTELLENVEMIEAREELGLPPLADNPSGKLFLFRKITNEESNVYKTLFTQKTKIEDYTDPIPIEVLDAYKLFKETCPDKICDSTIWHSKEYDPDPLLVVGCRKVGDTYDWADWSYIVARWGDSLEPFEFLAEKALKIWKSKRARALNEIETQLSNLKKNLRSDNFIDSTDHPTLHLPPTSHMPF